MRSLADVQREFARAIFSRAEIGAAFAPGSISSEEALRVHRNTVIGALVGALRLTYPTIDRLVGEAFFDQAAAAFAERQPPFPPPVSPRYGEGFADFLLSYGPAASLSYLPDVARLDLAIDRATLGPGDGVRTRHAIDDNVSMSLPEGLRVLSLNHPADTIKDALDADDDNALKMIDLQPKARWLVVWRVERQILVKPIGAAAGAFLQALLSGTPANRALAAAAALSSLDAATQEIQSDVFAASFCHIRNAYREATAMTTILQKPISALEYAFGLLNRVPLSLLLLIARIATFSVFFRSGLVKLADWSGLVKLADWSATLQLFENEYKVPVIPPHFAAYMSASMELGLSSLVLIGFATRFSVLGLLGMVSVIQIFVYPMAWPDHIQWLAFMIFIVCRGPGAISVDYALSRAFGYRARSPGLASPPARH